MYFVDPAGDEFFEYDYDIETGTPTNRRFFACLGDDAGKPDGSTVDAAGNLCNARFGGGCVQCSQPDGTAGYKVVLPVPNVTCCAIGGTDMEGMFVGTARILTTKAELAATPEAGALFVADLSVKGIPAGVYRE
jgi:sugar lactone lactonase YvrE